MNQITIKEIINNDVRDFSIYNCERSIPSGVDGLKTSQRKVIFGMMKKFPTQETKVSIVSATEAHLHLAPLAFDIPLYA